MCLPLRWAGPQPSRTDQPTEPVAEPGERVRFRLPGSEPRETGGPLAPSGKCPLCQCGRREGHAGSGRALLDLRAVGTRTGWAGAGETCGRPEAESRWPPRRLCPLAGLPPCQPTEPALGLGRPGLPSWGCGVANLPPPGFLPGQPWLAAGHMPHRIQALRGPAQGGQGGRVLTNGQEGAAGGGVQAPGATPRV